jgi:hypothetical protein
MTDAERNRQWAAETAHQLDRLFVQPVLEHQRQALEEPDHLPAWDDYDGLANLIDITMRLKRMGEPVRTLSQLMNEFDQFKSTPPLADA